MLGSGRTFCASCSAVTTLSEGVPAACIMGSNLYCLREFDHPSRGCSTSRRGILRFWGCRHLFCTRNARSGAHSAWGCTAQGGSTVPGVHAVLPCGCSSWRYTCTGRGGGARKDHSAWRGAIDPKGACTACGCSARVTMHRHAPPGGTSVLLGGGWGRGWCFWGGPQRLEVTYQRRGSPILPGGGSWGRGVVSAGYTDSGPRGHPPRSARGTQPRPPPPVPLKQRTGRAATLRQPLPRQARPGPARVAMTSIFSR